MKIGVDYYPEHWPRERWPMDAALMRDAGITVVRVGESAWARMEPEPERLDFDWLDEAVAL
jgi:beta-galactosidase